MLSCPKGESSLVGKISACCFSLKIFSLLMLDSLIQFQIFFLGVLEGILKKKGKRNTEPIILCGSPAIILGQSMLQFTQN